VMHVSLLAVPRVVAGLGVAVGVVNGATTCGPPPHPATKTVTAANEKQRSELDGIRSP
jgi:hypothetical protein